MRVSRYKKFQRYINFFQQHFQLHPPYLILIDGTFANAVLAARVNMKEQLPKCFDNPCRLLTTPCVLIETEQLGPTLYGAVQVLKGLQLHKCGHSEPLRASECLRLVITTKQTRKPSTSKHRDSVNSETRDQFIVATQDANLREEFRKLVGIPLLYLHGNAPTMEKPSDASTKWAERTDKKKIEVSNYQKEILKHFKDEVLPSTEGSTRKGTKKRKRLGPNPLSCKKSKKPKSSECYASTSSQQSEPEVKKKRKRIKVRVPKHVKELTRWKW